MDDNERTPHVPHKDHVEHDEDKEVHVKALLEADQVLQEAGAIITSGRQRLQASIDRYRERTHDPR